MIIFPYCCKVIILSLRERMHACTLQPNSCRNDNQQVLFFHFCLVPLFIQSLFLRLPLDQCRKWSHGAGVTPHAPSSGGADTGVFIPNLISSIDSGHFLVFLFVSATFFEELWIFFLFLLLHLHTSLQLCTRYMCCVVRLRWFSNLDCDLLSFPWQGRSRGFSGQGGGAPW